MTIAKRTLRVGKKELHELFGIPEDIEILAVRNARGWDDEEAFEFLLASGGEVEVNGFKITVEEKDGESRPIRRINLDTIKKVVDGTYEEPVNKDNFHSVYGSTTLSNNRETVINIAPPKEFDAEKMEKTAKKIIEKLRKINNEDDE